MEPPSLSIIIPTCNSSRSLGECLGSIRAQDYPAEKIEIIIVDAGSTDATLDIASEMGVNKILPNPLKTGEAGKAIGIEAASGEIITFIDSDNILDGDDWLKKMVLPLENPDIVWSECYAFTYRPTDSAIDRYCSLLGVNDPIHLFLGNYDRLSTLTGKWTGLPVEAIDRGDYYEVVLTGETTPTMGANGCLIRKSAIEEVDHHPYYFDIDAAYQLVCRGHNRVGMVKKGIVHLYCPDLRTFARKQKRRIEDFLHYKRLGRRAYPHQKYFWGYVKFVLSCVLVVPLLIQSLRGYVRKKDLAWFIHPVACWLTLITYGWATVRSLFVTAEFDRSDWSQ
ncbi:MAG: glycosyltransferase family 2 protein [Candidatus Hydrogenedentota bacterium]|nr:MAG: glycosyltransferase family 2 protein [Candidatus Hydrogenedentota bacterium]